LVQANNGDLYGTTSYGGSNEDGVVFEITTKGALTTIYSFSSQTSMASLIQGTDSDLYGEAYGGGAYGAGSLFKITPTGTFTTLYSFCAQSGCPDGAYPGSTLVQYTDGNLYGTAPHGGANNDGTVFSLSTGLAPFVETRPTSGDIGAPVAIIGTNLGSATSVTFDGVQADFTIVADSEIIASVPTGAKTGLVKVSTSAAVLASNKLFHVIP
jgi:uncharacterized repeat protein (TIGR03803 family)